MPFGNCSLTLNNTTDGPRGCVSGQQVRAAAAIKPSAISERQRRFPNGSCEAPASLLSQKNHLSLIPRALQQAFPLLRSPAGAGRAQSGLRHLPQPPALASPHGFSHPPHRRPVGGPRARRAEGAPQRPPYLARVLFPAPGSPRSSSTVLPPKRPRGGCRLSPPRARSSRSSISTHAPSSPAAPARGRLPAQAAGFPSPVRRRAAALWAGGRRAASLGAGGVEAGGVFN